MLVSPPLTEPNLGWTWTIRVFHLREIDIDETFCFQDFAGIVAVLCLQYIIMGSDFTMNMKNKDFARMDATRDKSKTYIYVAMKKFLIWTIKVWSFFLDSFL